MKKNNKIAICLAARSGSKRLPNKHFLKINSKMYVSYIKLNYLEEVPIMLQKE